MSMTNGELTSSMSEVKILSMARGLVNNSSSLSSSSCVACVTRHTCDEKTVVIETRPPGRLSPGGTTAVRTTTYFGSHGCDAKGTVLPHEVENIHYVVQLLKFPWN